MSARAAPITLLDGPAGTELERRGLALPAPLWSARAVLEAPALLAEIHADYARAGAHVHTAATFRTTERALRGTAHAGSWRSLARAAVALCREAAGPGARVAGSIAPLEDCYSPERTPDGAALAREHAALAGCLADAGCDLLLVETMPTLRELAAATRAAAATRLPVWAAVTLGPRGVFFDAAALAEARRIAGAEGASAFLVNCSAPAATGAALGALGEAATAGAAGAAAARDPTDTAGRAGDPALGAYANALFGEAGAWSPERYVAEADTWARGGATILGGCCGTTPAHLSALKEHFGARAAMPGLRPPGRAPG